jgi:hypothetical protein
MVEERHPSVRHERSDASFGWVLGLIVGSLGLAALTFWLLLVLVHRYQDYQAASKRSSYPLARAPQEGLPPEPRLEQLDRLQGIEGVNVRERQISKEEILGSYGSTSQEGFIHIPIDRAIRLLENHLPVRKETPPGDRRRENGLVNGGESNSGRMFREARRWNED